MDEQVLMRMEAMPDRFAGELDDLTESELRKRPQEGGWNIKQVVGHLRDAEQMWGQERLSRILTEDNPRLPAYDQEEYLRRSDVEHAALGELITEWKSFRQQTVATLRGLGPEEQNRPGVHEELGPVTPRDIVSRLAAHDEQHLQQVLHLKGMSREPSS